MPVVSLHIPDSLLKDLDLMADLVGYASRSEAIRDAVRSYISEQRMYRKMKQDVYNVLIFLYKDDENERNRISRVKTQFHRIIESETTFKLTKGRSMTVLLSKGTSDETRMLTSRIRGIRGIEQTRYIMVEQ